MAVERPWVTPDDLVEFSSHKEVTERESDKLAFDILRAEQKVMYITHNKFDQYDAIPDPVKLAIMLIAEAYAKNAVESTKKQITSETFDDYSYTADSSTIDLASLDLDDLLADYILAEGTGRVVMKLRKL